MPYEWRPVTDANPRNVIADYVHIYPVNVAKKNHPPKYVMIEQPMGYTDADLRRRYQAGRACPQWWVEWHSTQQWIQSLQNMQQVTPEHVACVDCGNDAGVFDGSSSELPNNSIDDKTFHKFSRLAG